MISSRKNPICSEIRRLRTDRSYRYEQRKFIADGIKLVDEALKWSDWVEFIIESESCKYHPIRELPVTIVTDDVMTYVSGMSSPQGVIAVCRMPDSSGNVLKNGTLILDCLQDPGNVGTILRTADALEIPVVLTDDCADPYNEKVVRASMGAIFRSQPVVMSRSEVIQECTSKNIPIAITSLEDSSVNILESRLTDCAVVIGNEGHGVGSELRQAAQRYLIIPMNPHCESFNAAVASTIIMWQMKYGTVR